MARCRCENSNCPCGIVAGPGIVLSGDGSTSSPFSVSTPPPLSLLSFQDTAGFDWTLSGTGRPGDPLIITGSPAGIDFSVTGTPGDVLTLQASGKYAPQAVGVPAGTIVTDGDEIRGDGTVGDPIRLAPVVTYGDLKLLT